MKHARTNKLKRKAAEWDSSSWQTANVKPLVFASQVYGLLGVNMRNSGPAQVVSKYTLLQLGISAFTMFALATVAQAESLNELLETYRSKSLVVDREAIKPALREKLEGLTLDELKRIEEQIPKPNICVDYLFPPLVEAVGKCALVVQGRVLSVDFTRERTIRNILSQDRSNFELSIELAVVNQYPEQPPHDTISYKAYMGWEYVSYIRPGSQYIFLFGERNGKLTGGGFTQVYTVDENGRVAHSLNGGSSSSIDETWDLIRSKLDAARGVPSENDADMWMVKLREGDLEQCAAAGNALSGMPGAHFSGIEIADALIRHYAPLRTRLNSTPVSGILEDLSQDLMTYREFASSAFELMTLTAEPPAVERVFELYVADISSEVDAVFESSIAAPQGLDVRMVKLVGAAPAEQRTGWLETLFTRTGSASGKNRIERYELVTNRVDAIKALGNVAGEDVTALLIRMARDPSRYLITRAVELGTVWSSLAARGDRTLQAEWEKVVAQDTPSASYGLTSTLSSATLGYEAREALKIMVQGGTGSDDSAS